MNECAIVRLCYDDILLKKQKERKVIREGEKMGNQYGPYVMYVLSQLLEKRQAAYTENESEKQEKRLHGQNQHTTQEAQPRKIPENDYFTVDETEADWHREDNTELLKQFCREGYAQAKKYGHFIVGTGNKGGFIGIPGRFLLEEQPAGGSTGFTLWQPLKGGEELYESLEEMDDEAAERIYGYWIAAVDSRTLAISEV